MKETTENGGQFTEVVFPPTAIITDQTQVGKANELNNEANKMYFIANSCKFLVKHISN